MFPRQFPVTKWYWWAVRGTVRVRCLVHAFMNVEKRSKTYHLIEILACLLIGPHLPPTKINLNFHQISKTVIDIPYEVVVGLRPFAPFMKPKFVPPTKQTWKLLANKNWVQKRTQSHARWLLRIEHLSSIINKKQHLSYSRGWLACASGHRFLAF